MIFHRSHFDSFFRPSRLVWEAPLEQPGDGSALVGIDEQDLVDAGVVDALPPDQAAAVQAATTESAEAPTEKKEVAKNVPNELVELVEAGLIKSPCYTADINEILGDPQAPLTAEQRTFLEKVRDGGDGALTVLNLQLKDYHQTKVAFSAGKMREVVQRSQENIIEHTYSMAKDVAKKGLDVLNKGMEKHPYGMLAAAAVLLYLAFTNRSKVGDLWKWGLGIAAGAIIAPMAVDALKGVPYVGDAVGSNNPAEKQTDEKKAKIEFLTGNLPPSFIAKIRQEDKNSGVKDDEGLLGFYELCQMSVSQFVDEMLKKDDLITEADVGIDFGDQKFKLTPSQRYKFGKELIKAFGFDPDDTSSLLAFKEQFGKNQEKLWMAAKVFPTSGSAPEAA